MQATIIHVLIAGLTIPMFAYFMFWGFLGQVAMLLVQLKKYFLRIKNEGGISPMFWLHDNKWRIIISFIAALALSPIAVLVAMKAPDVNGLMEFTCVGAGAMIDKTVEAFTNKKK